MLKNYTYLLLELLETQERINSLTNNSVTPFI